MSEKLWGGSLEILDDDILEGTLRNFEGVLREASLCIRTTTLFVVPMREV